MKSQQRIKELRIVGLAEGVSFCLLLLVAMPLKYLLGIPLAVKLVGWAHGGLFVAYILVVLRAKSAMNWSFFQMLVALAASLIPIGTFLLDKHWKLRLESIQKSENKMVEDKV